MFTPKIWKKTMDTDLLALVPVVKVAFDCELVMEDGKDGLEDEMNHLGWLLVTLQLGVRRRIQLAHIVSQFHQHETVKHYPRPVVVTLSFTL